jgi:hypothetical protein
MGLFSKQKVYCQICGKEFETDFHSASSAGYGKGRPCCSKPCWEELEWRRTLALMGKEYMPQPEERK